MLYAGFRLIRRIIRDDLCGYALVLAPDWTGTRVADDARRVDARAVERLFESGFLKTDARVLIYNTGAGLKYLEAYSALYPRMAGGAADKLGGLITPR